MARYWNSRSAARRNATHASRSAKKYGVAPVVLLGVWSVGIAVIMHRYYLDYNKLSLEAKVHFASLENPLFVYNFILPTVLISAACVFAGIILDRRAKRLRRERLDALMRRDGGVTPEEFLKRRLYDDAGDFTGIYVLHNETNGKYYVGQSVHVLQRVHQHFAGRGNGDVYADWKNGDSFTIQTTRLVDTDYDNLNNLERDAIEAYDAYGSGYNRTSGNNA